MVKLTPQLIDDAVERTNPVSERELILRGLKFSVIENLGIGLDQYDAYDLCDNDIQKFGNFPNLVRCKMVYAANNRISYIGCDIHVKLPNLNEICLINNDVRSMTNLKRLEKCECLKYLSLTRNPIILEKNYRKFAIFIIKSLKFLDFQRITDKERADAKNFFEKTQEGQQLLAKIHAKAKDEAEDILFGEDDIDEDLLPADDENEDGNNNTSHRKNKKKRKLNDKTEFEKSKSLLNGDGDSGTMVDVHNGYMNDSERNLREIDEEQRAKIKKAILTATSVEEIERLNRMLQAGYIPTN